MMRIGDGRVLVEVAGFPEVEWCGGWGEITRLPRPEWSASVTEGSGVGTRDIVGGN